MIMGEGGEGKEEVLLGFTVEGGDGWLPLAPCTQAFNTAQPNIYESPILCRKVAIGKVGGCVCVRVGV